MARLELLVQRTILFLGSGMLAALGGEGLFMATENLLVRMDGRLVPLDRVVVVVELQTRCRSAREITQSFEVLAPPKFHILEPDGVLVMRLQVVEVAIAALL